VASLTLTSITLAAGDTLLVGAVGADSAMTDVTWNGNAMTQDVPPAGISASVCASIWRYRASGGATGSIVATAESSTNIVFVAIKHDLLDASPLDKQTADDNAGSVNADSGNTATTAQADEFLFGIVGAAGVSTDTAPTWLNSFTGGQFDKNAGTGTKALCAEGYHTVAATAAYKAAATLTNSREWGAAIATYKITTAQTSTPDPTSAAVAALDAVGVAGVATSVPDPVSAAMEVLGGTNVLGARSVTPDPVSVPLVANEKEEAGGTIVVDMADRNPVATTSMNVFKVDYNGGDAQLLKLSDGDTNTYRQLGFSRPPGPNSGTITIPGSILDAALPDPGITITHVILRGLAAGFAYAGSSMSNPRLEYGSPTQTKDLTTFVIRTTSPGYFAPDQFATDPILTRPDGGAWTWADVTALGAVNFKIDYTLNFDGTTCEAYLYELWAEVYGAIGSYVPPITFTAKMPKVKRAQQVVAQITEE